MKHGQVSIFILIGILILLFVGFFVLYGYEKLEKLPLKTEEASLQLYVETCLAAVGEDGVHFISTQGGYYQQPSYFYALGQYTIPYYYDGREEIPSIEVIEQQLGMYIDNNLFLCLEDFAPFIEQGYTVAHGDPNTTTHVQENQIFYTTALEMTLKKEKEIITYNSFSATIDSHFYTLYQIAKEIAAVHPNNYEIPLRDILLIAEENNIAINMAHFNNTVIYKITKDKINKNVETSEQFFFAVFYAWGDPFE